MNYGFLFTLLLVRLIFSYYNSDYGIITDGLVGFGSMFVISCIMFYTGQWGGGDAKLLWGMGALFGVQYEVGNMVIFLLNLVVVGGIYGLIWTFYLFVKDFDKSMKEFNKRLTIIIFLVVFVLMY